MQIIKKYQNEVYSLALSLTGNGETSKKVTIKAFETVLRAYHADSHETKIELYKKLLKNIGFFDIKKNDLNKKGVTNSVKCKLALFDKKVFILKYEFKCGLKDICYILSANPEKVKKSLIKSAARTAKTIEETESEM